MEQLLPPELDAIKAIPFWKNPSAWIKEQNLGRSYWVFFSVALFFDAGFSIYVFLFNLYLLDLHFNERAIGLVGGAQTLGSVVGLIPAGMLAQKIGIRRLLFFCLSTAPLLSVIRAWWMWEPAQMGLAFVTGLALCCWGICFLPAVARLTTEKNRTTGFSLIFSASIATSALGGVVCGYLPKWLELTGIAMPGAEVKQLILMASCGLAAFGLIPALRLALPPQTEGEADTEFEPPGGRWFQNLKLSPFLLRFLPLMALWSAVQAGFNPFANIYLSNDLRIPMTEIGLIFSTVQIVQFCLGLVAPFVFRALGLVNGVAATQIFAALALGCLAGTHNSKLAILAYLIFAAAQWMSAPGLYNVLMNETPDKERSMASAMTMLCNALAGSAATAGAGILFTSFGYPSVLFGIAAGALAVATLFRLMIKPAKPLEVVSQT